MDAYTYIRLQLFKPSGNPTGFTFYQVCSISQSHLPQVGVISLAHSTNLLPQGKISLDSLVDRLHDMTRC